MEPLSPTRREVLRFAAGLGLTAIWPRSVGAQPAGKSLIVLWLSGGPSQLETWDPHPRLMARGHRPTVETRIEGVRFAAGYPRLAQQMHRLSVIRSLVSMEGDHERATRYLKTGYRPDPTADHPSLTAVVAHKRPNRSLEIPSHVSLGVGQWPAWGGYLGAEFDAFKVSEPGATVGNLTCRIDDPDRQRRRRDALTVVSSAFRHRRELAVDRTRHLDTVERAFRMMRSPDVAAFRLDDEPAATRDRYGRHPFGAACLVTRRLIERGVPAVEVTLPGFDAHTAVHEAHEEAARVLDPAFASLVDDLATRDLLRSTVVLAIGEFGRTPQLNLLEGRDHWPHGFSCIVGGGGIRPGRVVGGTDPEGRRRAPTDPVPVEDLTATVLTALSVDPEDELTTAAGRPLRLSAGTPIRRLL